VANPFQVDYHAYLDGVKDTVGFEARELGNSIAVSVGEQIGIDYVSSHVTWYLTEEQVKKLQWELTCFLDNKAFQEQADYIQSEIDDQNLDESRLGSCF